jgi:hypothetical protein
MYVIDFHFTCDIEYHNMAIFKQTSWNEKNTTQIPFQHLKKKH